MPVFCSSPPHRPSTAFGDCIVALYARGLTRLEIQGYLAEAYGTEVGHDLISTVTDGVLAEVSGWQARPLEAVYPAVFFDAIRLKVREDNIVRNKAVYLALGEAAKGSACAAGGKADEGCGGMARARSSACGSRPPRVQSSG